MRVSGLHEATAFTLAFGVLCLTGCVGTETGNPLRPPVQRERVALQAVDNGVLEVRGNPGAVDPPGGEVQVTNLERVDPPTEVPVDADGSFFTRIQGLPEDAIRIARRSAEGVFVLDVALELGGATVEVPPPLDCVEFRVGPVTGLRHLAFDAETDVVIELVNGCGTAFMGDVSLRRGDQGLSVMAGLFAVDEDGTSPIMLGVDPLRSGTLEDEMLVNLEGNLLAVTLVVEATPVSAVGECVSLTEAECDTRTDCEWVTRPGFPGPISLCEDR